MDLILRKIDEAEDAIDYANGKIKRYEIGKDHRIHKRERSD